MEERIARTIRNIKSLDALAQFELNARSQNALTDEIKDAIRARSSELGRALITERTGLQLLDLTPAEEKIVAAVSEYVGVMKRQGKDATRTLGQLANRGLLESAEVSVSKSTPTQGFQVLADEKRADLSYEQIVVDHPAEFSPRALWYSRQTLGLPNDSPKPPARSSTPIQLRTTDLIRWLRERSENNGGRIPLFTNAEAATMLGMADLSKYGRVYGNIQSRIDYACYVAKLPPLGLSADAPFSNAWQQEGRDWAFPIHSMQAAAQSRVWSGKDFDNILRGTQQLSGQAHIAWKNEITANEAGIKTWAFGLETHAVDDQEFTEEGEPESRPNPPWSRNELILALDLYLRFRTAPPGKESVEVGELSATFGADGERSRKR